MSITAKQIQNPKVNSSGVGRIQKRLPRELAVIGAFGVLALVFTWPLALHFNQAVPGEDHRDAWQMVWNLWWVRYALEHAQNPFQTGLIFYPQGTGLYLHALNALNGLLSLPVQYLGGALGGAAGGAVAGYNFIVLFSLTVGAYGAFCLARYLWGDPKAALVAGLAYGFSTYNFDHLLGHLNLVSSEFIPFYILFFLKALQPGSSNQKLEIRNILAAVGFLIGLVLLELQYVLYMAIFSGLYLAYLTAVWGWQRGRKQASGFRLTAVYGRAGAIAVLFVLLTLPLTLPMLNEALNNPNTVPPRQDTIYSADLLAYFYPSPFHPLWGETMLRAIKPFTATLIEKVVFPGFTVYLLTFAGFILAFWRGRINRDAQDEQDKDEIVNSGLDSSKDKARPTLVVNQPGFWVLTAVTFAILSFGRRLHINGVEHGPPLPATLIYELPILNITRVPSRFAVVAILALGLLAAWGLGWIGRRLTGRGRWYNLVVGVALAALAFELLPAPYPLTFYSVPEFYRSLAADPRTDYAILDVPLNYGRYQYTTDYLEDQMTHRKPLLNGYISRNPVYPPYYGVPTLLAFRDLSPEVKPDILPAQPLDLGVLRYFGVRYISIRKDILSGGERSRAFETVSRLLPGQAPIADEPAMAVYEVPPGPKATFFYNPVLPSWYEAEKGPGGKMSRWAQGDKPTLDFWTAEPRQLEIEFSARSFQEPHSVEFLLNGTSVGQSQIGLAPQTVRLKLDLRPGQNQLILKIGGRAIRPADLGPSPDIRPLSLSVGEISFITK